MAHWARRCCRSSRGAVLINRSYYKNTAQCEEATEGLKILDGRLIAQKMKEEIGANVREMGLRMGVVPGLALVQVGDSPQSQTYVGNLRAACTEVGIRSFVTHFPESVALRTVLQAIQVFNADRSIHGIVVQHPLPQKMRPESLLQNISLDKDVDGLHPMNLGSLALEEHQPSFVPCTSRACLELLTRYNFRLERRRAVVIGCSKVVGLPIALLLQRHNATVTIVDKHTPTPAEITSKADILISATGNANLVRRHWIKPGAVVIDVGMNIVEDPCVDEGFRFVGDVCFEEAERVAAAITPVPGGVGPITIAMVLSNTLLAAQKQSVT